VVAVEVAVEVVVAVAVEVVVAVAVAMNAVIYLRCVEASTHVPA
jgi:hypothetical protein